MGKIGILFSALMLLLLWGCGNMPNENINYGRVDSIENDSVRQNYTRVYDSLRGNMNGACFTDTIRVTKLLSFSNSINPDTFELIVPRGPIAKTTSELIIKTFQGKIIYENTFKTDYFSSGIFEADTTRVDGGIDAYDKHMLSYVLSLTKRQFEEYGRKNIDEFFKDMDTKHETDIGDEVDIVDTALYEVYKKDTSMKTFFLLCFDCDEGGSFMCYSPKEGKVKAMLSSD